MGIVAYGGEVNLWGTDKNVFKVIKVRDKWNCNKCSKAINKGNYCWGSGYQKFCIECGLIVCENAIVKLDEILTDIKRKIKDVEFNKDKYITENVVGNL